MAGKIGDIREVMRVLREQSPAPGFEFIDHLVRISAVPVLTQLEADLEQRLKNGDSRGITLVAPAEHQLAWADARLLRLQIGSSCSSKQYTEIALDDVLRRARVQAEGKRVESLKRGKITLFAHPRGNDALADLHPYACLEVESSLGSRRFALVEGHWYEVDASYLADLLKRVSKLFAEPSRTVLPAWDRT